MGTLEITGEFEFEDNPISFLMNVIKEPDKYAHLLDQVVEETEEFIGRDDLLRAWDKMLNE